jgi:hypothetical protein
MIVFVCALLKRPSTSPPAHEAGSRLDHGLAQRDAAKHGYGMEGRAQSSKSVSVFLGGDGVMAKSEFISAQMWTRVTAHALHVGDRVNTMGSDGEPLSAVPRAIRVSKDRHHSFFAWRCGSDQPFT